MQNDHKSAEDINTLWQEYSQNPTLEIRNQLVEHYLPLVNIIAGRMAMSLPG